ncbi:endonuclease/exonuclease/phosphatase family protein [Halarcobacter ebronensis]|uniref:Endonuclease n=1 Tax=Halarcobacter ebronensis TaxID=1462615 RepID=A0A4Q1AGW7_9BACT|nr:endonuclease/exonuclease/phosphatase family protein [Halarcobacter ebronensis]QKF82951.1 endonuclease/exonuclease/phosphatase [Halarcobacter ebronensis]RXK02851.1 endonuclease [Halarcobacter ebronensis]
MNIKIATFNLFQFCAPPYSWYFKKDKFNENEWEKKKEWLNSQIESIDCDIIGFQEVFSQKELQRQVKALGFKYFVTVDKPKLDENNETIFTTTTLALASKFPIKKVEKVTSTLEGFNFSRKPIKALISLPNGIDITFYVNHFKSNRLNEFEHIFKKEDSVEYKKKKVFELLNNLPSQKQRLQEASLLYSDFLKTETPIISLCDLNDKEFSLTLDCLTNQTFHQEQEKNSFLLFDAFYLLNSDEKRVPTSYYKGVGNVLDYIHVSKEFLKEIGEVVSYKVWDEHLKQNKNGSLLQSDHAIVSCEISIY